MFAYLLIAFELAFLYAAFWYVFIREPKPFRITGRLWGSYEPSAARFSQADLDTLILDYKESAKQNVYFDRRVPRRPILFPLPLKHS